MLEIYIKPGNASKETIQAVLDSLSRLHIAAGGLGLVYEYGGAYSIVRGGNELPDNNLAGASHERTSTPRRRPDGR